MKSPNWVMPCSAMLFLASCAIMPNPTQRMQDLATTAGFIPVAVPDTRLRAFYRARQPRPAPGSRLTIYIESDGAPWVWRDTPPDDPTPRKPLVLRMATADPSASVAYLGRLCQHLNTEELSRCNPQLWMRARFSEEAVVSTNRAIEALKQRSGAKEINLAGYSGGGAMAALVAARRSDVHCLVTVAAPLDTKAWTSAIQVSPLDLSLNPADMADQLRSIRQTHFRGGRDKLVPAITGQRFLERVSHAGAVQIDEFDHGCCWDDSWQELRQQSCLADNP